MKNKYPGVFPVVDSAGNTVKGKFVLRMCVTVNGVSHRDTRTVEANTAKQAYEQKLDLIEQLKVQYENGVTSKTVGVLYFSELVNKWYKVGTGGLVESSLQGYEKIIDKSLIPCFGDMCLSEIKRRDILEYIDHEKSAGNSDNTIKNKLNVLRVLFGFAETRQYIPEGTNPVLGIKSKDFTSKKQSTCNTVQYFTEEQMHNILTVLDRGIESEIEAIGNSIRYSKLDDVERERVSVTRLCEVLSKRVFINIAMTTGARRGEIIGLRWSDISIQDNIIEISFNGTAYEISGEGTKYKDFLKNGDDCKVGYMPIEMAPMLIEYKEQLSKCVKLNKWGDKDYVFYIFRKGRTEAAGQLARLNTYTAWFHKWCIRNKDAIGLSDEAAKEAHVHMLRHSFCTYALMNGIGFKTVAKLAGHKDAKMTINIYGHTYDETLQQGAVLFSGFYNKK